MSKKLTQFLNQIKETKSAPKGYHFTKDGKLKRGDADVDGPGGAKLRSDPLDKQRSKVPPVSEEITDAVDLEEQDMYGSTYEVHKDGFRPKVVKNANKVVYLGSHVYKSKEHAKDAADGIGSIMRKGRAGSSYIQSWADTHHKEHGLKEALDLSFRNAGPMKDYFIKNKDDKPPFTPDAPKAAQTNSDGTKTSPMSRAKQLAKMARNRNMKREQVDESQQGMYTSAAKELKTYADKRGGMDKDDFHTAAKHIENIGKANILQKGDHLAKLSSHLRNLDTSPREKVLSVLHSHGHKVSDFGGYKMRNEAKSFDQRFKDHLKFATSKSPAVQARLKKRVDDRDAMNKQNDPNAAKKGYALSAVPPERAFKKAMKKGMSASDASQAVGTASRNKKRKLPEGLDEKKLTPAEMKKREEIAKAMERENPNMPMPQKMAIATAQAKKVAEDTTMRSFRDIREMYGPNQDYHEMGPNEDSINSKYPDLELCPLAVTQFVKDFEVYGMKRVTPAVEAVNKYLGVERKVLNAGTATDQDLKDIIDGVAEAKAMLQHVGIAPPHNYHQSHIETVRSMIPVNEAVDDEGSMAKGQLRNMVRNAIGLMQKMQDNTQLDGWVQSKLTKASDYLDSVHDYLMNNTQDVDKQNEHWCAKHVYSDLFGEGIVLEGEHGNPDDYGNIEWYNVQFEHGVETIFTEDIEILNASYHGHKKKKNEEGMDAVGQADADIDNDGDVDDSDKYLHNRRKAIKKAMKK